MGIPKFARFIVSRYPLVLQKLKENPEIVELDNLYLDMNGIIHIMSHNNSFEKMIQNRSYEDIFYDVFKYVDQLVHLTKPLKLLMIAADGVAPRAKMNQQRTRRFKKNNLDSNQLNILKQQGKEMEDIFNSDCISAGTEFMQKLSEAFDLYISVKMAMDPLWKNLKVIFSGADVPGEGEHKITDYIRKYKATKDFDPNSTHCIYGLDADLIMLGLVTHLPNVYILREEVLLQKKKKTSNSSGYRDSIKISDSFEIIHISLLREYLEIEFSEVKEKISFEYNPERVIDDFLFICFFIGNDFLPSLNTLDIDEGSLDKIFEIYKNALPQLDNYITYHGKIDFKRAEVFFKGLAKLELDSLQSMLKKLEFKCRERDDNRKRVFEEKKRNILKQKFLKKKQKKMKEEVAKMNDEEKRSYKKKLIQRKLDKLKAEYTLEMSNLNLKNKVFEEDVIKFNKGEAIFDGGNLSSSIPANLSNIGKQEGSFRNNQPIVNNNDSFKPSNQTSQVKNYNQGYQASPRHDSNTHIYNNNSEYAGNTTEDQRNLATLFDSSDDPESDFSSKMRFNNKKYPKGKDTGRLKSTTIPHDTIPEENSILETPPTKADYLREPYERRNIFQILKQAVKYASFLEDANYYSDINIKDIENSDVSDVSDIETDELVVNYNDGFNAELIQYQDYEKVFQQKLIGLYINNVPEAKNFYYKEKVKLEVTGEKGKEQKKKMFQKYLEGLQWVLYYYYRGVQSWRWFYPYHYPPMISDFESLESTLDYDMDKVFADLKNSNLDAPLLPFQSLIMILPETSKSLLPKAYHSVYQDIPDNYPKNFIIDFNGKRLPWEALVILPFVDEDQLRAYEEEKRHKYHPDNTAISEEERDLVIKREDLKRNGFGSNWLYYYNKNNKHIPATTKFKCFDFSQYYFTVSKEVIVIDDFNYDPTQTDNPVNEYNYAKKTSCFRVPSFSDIKFQYFFNKTNDFPSRGKKPYLGKKPKVLSIMPVSVYDRVSDEAATKLIEEALRRKEVFVNYPYKTNAKLIGAVYYDSYMYIHPENNKFIVEPYTFPGEMKSEMRSFLQRKGIYLEPINTHIYLEIVPFDRYVRSQNGQIRKLFHEKDRYFTPIEITSLNVANDCQTFNILVNYKQSQYAIYNDAKAEFKTGEKALILTNSNYGGVVVVDNILTNTGNSKEYNKFNELNYTTKYYDTSINYDLSERDWKVSLNELYCGDLVGVRLFQSEEQQKIAKNKETVEGGKDKDDDFFDSINMSSQKTKNQLLEKMDKNEVVNQFKQEIGKTKTEDVITNPLNKETTQTTQITPVEAIVRTVVTEDSIIKKQEPTPENSLLEGKVEFSILRNYDNIPSKSIKNILKKSEEFYISMDELAKKMGISNWTLSVISSCLYVVDFPVEEELEDGAPLSELPHWNLGLNIKSNKGSKLILPGYTRYFSGDKNCYNWEYSTLAVKLIEDYRLKFKFVFDALEKRFNQYSLNKYFKLYDLFVPEITREQLDEVSKWISIQEISGISFCTVNSNFLNSRDVQKIETFIYHKLQLQENYEIEDYDGSNVGGKVNNQVKKTGKSTSSNQVQHDNSLHYVNPNYLIIEKLPYVERFTDIQLFKLGDRVVNIRSDDKRFVPFGLKGTITGVSEAFVEVMFDFPFFGGDTCNNRLPFGKGLYVETINLLNITSKASVFLRRNQESFEPINYKFVENQQYDYFDYPNNKGNLDNETMYKSQSKDGAYPYKGDYAPQGRDEYLDQRSRSNFSQGFSGSKDVGNNNSNKDRFIEVRNKKKILVKEVSNDTYQSQNQNYNDPSLAKSNSVFQARGVDDFFEKYADAPKENAQRINNNERPKIIQNPTFGKTSFVEDYSGSVNTSNQNTQSQTRGLNFSKGNESKKISGDKKRFQKDNFFQGQGNGNYKDKERGQDTHDRGYGGYSNNKNISQYRSDRIFQNEKIKKNDVYYFAKDPVDYQAIKNINPNII